MEFNSIREINYYHQKVGLILITQSRTQLNYLKNPWNVDLVL